MLKLVLWDWNNTLLNDNPIWDKTRIAVFESFGAQAPTLNVYVKTLAEVNGNYQRAYERFGLKKTKEELNKVYEQEYIKNLTRVRLHNGAEHALIELCSVLQIPCGIVTAQPKTAFFAAFDCFPFLELCFVYIEYNKHNTPQKAKAIREICKKEGVTPNECLYIGDTISDIQAARKAKAKTAFYRNEYNQNANLSECRPDYEIADLKEIPDIVKRS